jgi:hypothetical protein
MRRAGLRHRGGQVKSYQEDTLAESNEEALFAASRYRYDKARTAKTDLILPKKSASINRKGRVRISPHRWRNLWPDEVKSSRAKTKSFSNSFKASRRAICSFVPKHFTRVSFS